MISAAPFASARGITAHHSLAYEDKVELPHSNGVPSGLRLIEEQNCAGVVRYAKEESWDVLAWTWAVCTFVNVWCVHGV